MISTFQRVIAGAGLVIALVAGSAVGAHAAPTPDNGPTPGATAVTLPMPAKPRLASVDAGGFTGRGVDTAGKLWGWGQNTNNQLGDGTAVPADSPVLAQPPTGVAYVKFAFSQTAGIALGDDGKAYWWGRYAYQPGVFPAPSLTHTSSSPIVAPLPTGVTATAVGAGYQQLFIIGNDGVTYAFGSNSRGELGVGSTTGHTSPQPIVMPPGVTFTQVTGGQYMSYGIATNGNLYAWGENASGRLGIGVVAANETTPQLVVAPTGVTFTQVASGTTTSIAVGSDGKAYTWGTNQYGLIGNGLFGVGLQEVSPVAALIPTGLTVTEVAVGNSQVAALTLDGEIYTWGTNAYGQLGDGTTIDRPTPVAVTPPAGVTFTGVETAQDFMVASGSDGNAYAWGSNMYGMLGDGTTGAGTQKSVPTMVIFDVEVTGVTFDGLPGTALLENGDGTVTVTTPAHAAGPVDVVLDWTINGVTQVPIVYASSFTYGTAPAVSDPADRTVDDGNSATFTVVVTGDSAPSVTWEVSTDGGVSWQPIATDAAAKASTDGRTLTVAGSAANDGYVYRALASNPVAPTAVSDGAVLTVNKVAGPSSNPGSGSASEPSPKARALATTGTQFAPLYGVIGAAVLLIAGGLLATSRKRASRRQ